MKYLHTALVTSVVISAAIWAAPGFAAESSGGNAGNGESPRAVPGGMGLSENAKPIDTLKIDEGSVTRDLELDPAKLEESFGTLQKTSGGDEKRLPASDEMMRMINGAANPGADPAFSNDEESRQVFGEDDRVQITDTSEYPFRAFGLLQSEGKDGSLGSCSATLIGARTLITAAHCLYSNEDGGWLNNFLFAPGIISMENAPFGVYEYESASVFEGFVKNYQGYYGSVVPWDIGVVVLKEPIGQYLGWMSYGYDDNLGDFFANIIGYPGDKPAGTQWRANCDVSAQAMTEMNFQYLCDTYPGSSGSSVYKYTPDNDDRTIYGINVAESPDANTAVRINKVYYQWLGNLVK